MGLFFSKKQHAPTYGEPLAKRSLVLSLLEDENITTSKLISKLLSPCLKHSWKVFSTLKNAITHFLPTQKDTNLFSEARTVSAVSASRTVDKQWPSMRLRSRYPSFNGFGLFAAFRWALQDLNRPKGLKRKHLASLSFSVYKAVECDGFCQSNPSRRWTAYGLLWNH